MKTRNDMRNGRKPELERSPLKWYPDLCKEIEIALRVRRQRQ